MGIPVFLFASNIDVPIIATIMASICTNTKSKIDFYIIDGFISHKNKKRIDKCTNCFNNSSVDFIRVDFSSWLNDYPELINFDKLALTKFLLPTLKPTLGRSIYIGKDIVFINGDLDQLYKIDMQQFNIAAVPLTTMLGNGLWSKPRLANIETLGLSDRGAVFDTSLMVIDIEEWNNQNITNKILTLTKTLICERKLFDSYDGLFSLLNGSYLKLDRSWNVPYHYAKTFYFDKKFDSSDMKVLHYNYSGDNNKPWNNKELNGSNFFWKYAGLTLFKDILERNPPSRIHDPTYWAKLKFRRKVINLIIKCLVSRKRYKKLKTHTDQFFADSKSTFIRFLGELYY